jgi:hypothetical protein
LNQIKSNQIQKAATDPPAPVNIRPREGKKKEEEELVTFFITGNLLRYRNMHPYFFYS